MSVLILFFILVYNLELSQIAQPCYLLFYPNVPPMGAFVLRWGFCDVRQACHSRRACLLPTVQGRIPYNSHSHHRQVANIRKTHKIQQKCNNTGDVKMCLTLWLTAFIRILRIVNLFYSLHVSKKVGAKTRKIDVSTDVHGSKSCSEPISRIYFNRTASSAVGDFSVVGCYVNQTATIHAALCVSVTRDKTINACPTVVYITLL